MAGCCRTEDAFYKLNDSHTNAATAIVVNNIPVVAVFHYQELIQNIFTSSLHYISDHTNDPPEKNHLQVYLLNCNFRI